ncbi:MAG: MoxR family ATPase [Eubacteriales bacterium]|nr:MoxR family ATPase [Eubacteriales bacterium]
MEKLTDQIQNEINHVVLGKEQIVRKVLLAILAKGHVLLEDVPGVGKTTLAKAFSKTLGLDSKRVQFTSDTLPSDIIGFSVFDKADNSMKYQPGSIMTNLLLADEINRTSSKTQSALLEAMEERQVTVDGNTRPLPSPFIVLATQNPVGSAGTQMLPSSQLDRFLIKLSMGYPDRSSTAALLKDRHHDNPLSSCRTVTDCESLEKCINEAMNVFVADRIYDYIAELVEETRNNAYVTLGISPRGALALARAAKANAYLDGRDYVIPQDVCNVFTDVGAHRLILNSKARLHEYSQEQIIANILENVKKPDVREFGAR